MSDFDPVGYGELRAQVAALEKDVAELRSDVRTLLELANRSKGGGAAVKVLDTTGANTGPEAGSVRFQKRGIYKFDGVFGSAPTRTFWTRSWAIVKNDGSMTPEALMAWLGR